MQWRKTNVGTYDEHVATPGDIVIGLRKINDAHQWILKCPELLDRDVMIGPFPGVDGAKYEALKICKRAIEIKIARVMHAEREISVEIHELES